ncbi:MAG: Rieske 2Fe-2S domain-containing protein [Candidatus Thiodiazotropha sp. LLP2]
MKRKTRVWVCHKDQIREGGYIRIDVLYANKPSSVIVFCYQGTYLAYRNLCVHMPKRLDCEKDMIFDDAGQNLRCSMHGIIFDPFSGESLSTICTGEKLTPVSIDDYDGGIWIFDKRVRPMEENLSD